MELFAVYCHTKVLSLTVKPYFKMQLKKNINSIFG